jgi:hypothetical protein
VGGRAEPTARTILAGRCGSGPAAPIPPKALLVLDVPYSVCRAYIVEHHYLGYAPCGGRLFLGVFSAGWMVGALMLGRPVARNEDQVSTLELTRMVLAPECEKNSESHVLAVVKRLVRVRFPGVHRLIAYSDPARGHKGTIYAAAGWRRVGVTQAGSWARSRPGRRPVHQSPKVKWEVVWGP